MRDPEQTVKILCLYCNMTLCCNMTFLPLLQYLQNETPRTRVPTPKTRCFLLLSAAAPSRGGGSTGGQYRGGDAQARCTLLSLSLASPCSPGKRLPGSAAHPALCLLAQMTWPTLRAEFPALSPAQLHRVLSQCQAVMDVGCITAWQPGEDENPAAFQPGEPLGFALSAAAITCGSPPRFLCTNRSGNSLPLPGAPVVTAVVRNNHGNLGVAKDAQKGLQLSLRSQVLSQSSTCP